ncbi:MAG TPA: aromatic ring-hydroxylating dioxygenase subunit alpha [Candidatus Udaeobacter sp.]|nr:aromatic ring-hydroxylating dioxygenase subunit alpha [Candidatus Udaeobacter sp.]
MPATQTRDGSNFRKSVATFRPGAETLPQRYFVSEEIFAEELQKVFATNWVLIGHQSQLTEPGDYFLAEVAGESLIVAKDQRSAIRAFYNVCRHRGARLCEEESGHAAAIQCPYHAWTYAVDGRLLGAPHMDETPGFNKAEYPLKPARLALWEGFIFLNLEDASTERGGYMSLEKWFEPLDGKFSAWNLASLRSAKRIEYDVQANWKLMFQNYSECYHCLGVHPELSKISPYDSAENDLTKGPFLGGFMRIANDKSLTMSGNACALPVGNFGDEDFRFVFYYSIFPNILLSLHPDYVMVHQLEPQSPDRTLIFCDWFFNPEASKRDDFNPNDAIEFWDMINKQDWHVCELSQKGISSRAYEPGPYSARESIPAAWDEYYLRQVG